MRTIRYPASTWEASTPPGVNFASRRFALLMTLNLATAAIYFVNAGHGIGLGGYRIDLDVYRTGARVVLHGGDLYGQLPRLATGQRLPFTYPPFAALTFIPLALLGYGTTNWLLTAATIASVAGQPAVLRRRHPGGRRAPGSGGSCPGRCRPRCCLNLSAPRWHTARSTRRHRGGLGTRDRPSRAGGKRGPRRAAGGPARRG
jgi:hypothetical protein